MRPTADGPHAVRLLVVDDEPSICQALALLFGWHGLEVTTALSAAEANQVISESQFDVLLIDLRLRDARGDAVFRAAIERDPAFRDRTLFMTGDITTEAERIIASTNCPYLRKPFDVTLAVQAIAALVGIAYQPPDAEAAEGRRQRAEGNE
ncbi:MAG TPA: response regulator [Gemmatimonadaceae bacterium]|jgi:DNA-binding NtrC family response regulator